MTVTNPTDPIPSRTRALAAEVARLRGWHGNDPARAGELADALTALTAHRLRLHAYADAAEDAQEALALAAKAVAAAGPLGPYTPVPDAARLATAATHLAVLQSALGLDEAAGRTLEAARTLQGEIRTLADVLAAETRVWQLLVRARVALESGDAAGANALADAAASRLERGDPESYQPMDVQRLLAATRWAAGLPDQAVLHGLAAVEEHRALIAGRLDGRAGDALVERLLEPIAAYGEFADQLLGRGDADLAVAIRRQALALVERHAPAQAPVARAGLAATLAAVGRADEAELLGVEFGRLDPPGIPAHVSWETSDDTDGAGRDRFAAAMHQVAARAQSWWAEAAQQEAAEREAAHLELGRRAEEARLAAERAEAKAERDRLAAERAAAHAAEAARLAEQERLRQEEADRIAAKRARRERKAAYEQEAERREIERLAAQRSDKRRSE